MRALLAIFLSLVWTLGSPVGAQMRVPASPPNDGKGLRTLRTFDFEERASGNIEDTPLGWVKVEGSGMPHYLKGQFDFSVAHSGETSFRLDLNGGSIAFRYPANRIFVADGAHYRIQTMVRSTELQNSRARLTAYFCDQDARPISSSIRSVELDPRLAEDEAFHPLALDMIATGPAVSLVVEIGVLQADLTPKADLGEHQLTVQDIHGSAWFDDVKITQIPDVEVFTDRPTNVFYKDEAVNIRLRLHDRLSEDLTAELRVFDIDNKPVFQHTGGIRFTPTASSNELLGTIPLPTLEPGWYQSQIVVRSDQTQISQHSLRFVQLGDSPGRPMPDERFGVVATSLPPAAWSILPGAMDQLAAGRLKLSVWTEDHGIESGSSGEFDRLVGKLRSRGIGFTACLASIPPEMAQRIGTRRWADLLQIPLERWQPQLAYLVSSHANHLAHWQLLDDDGAERMVQDKPMREVYGKLLSEFRHLVDDPDLAMPWPAWVELDQELPSTVALRVPAEILPEQLPLYIADLRAHRGKTVSLVLSPIDRDRYGRLAQEKDLALRIAYAFVGGADRVDLPLLLDARTQRGNTTAEPDPLFVVQRTLLTHLSGATCLGLVPISDGVDAVLFSKEGEGVMLVWARGEPDDQTLQRIPIALGQDPLRVELTGQTTPIRRTLTDPRRPDDRELVVGTKPILITRVDPALLMLRASVGLDNPKLESSVRSQGRTLVIRNTFDTPISGTVRLTGPSGWKLPIRNTHFSLAPGETYSEPVTIEFPLNSTTGQKSLIAELSVEGRRDYRLNVPVPVTIGLSDVGLQTIAMKLGGHIFVQQFITNYGDAKIDYTAFASMPGQSRQERLVTNLSPGQTLIKKYRFNLPALGATRVRSGIRELEGRRMLNEDVPIQ